jgi:inosine-uridine nucleoside N-ribohydrolase
MLLEPGFAESLADLVIMGGVFAGTTGSATAVTDAVPVATASRP